MVITSGRALLAAPDRPPPMSEAAQLGEAIGTGVAIGLFAAIWLGVLILLLVCGAFARNPAIVERGPTGPLARTQPAHS